MGKQNEKLIGLGVATGLAVVVLWATWTISAHHSQSAAEANFRAGLYAEGVGARIHSACAGAEAAALVECVANEVESTREHQRAEKDLGAQDRMAKWALWMVGLSALTAGLTAAALWFVKGTLDEARATTVAVNSANEFAEKSVAIQNRAYVHATGARIAWGAKPFVEIRVVNAGATPATEVRIDSKLLRKPAVDRVIVENLSTESPQLIAAPGTWVRVAAEDQAALCNLISQRLKECASSGSQVVVRGQVSFKTIYGESFRAPFRFFVLKADASGSRQIMQPYPLRGPAFVQLNVGANTPRE
jgi:hypothetical protein